MHVFVRKNALVCCGTFTAADGSATQPTSAEAVLTFLDTSGATRTVTVPLTNSAGVWSGIWDSSAAEGCVVDWMIHCWGGLTAAAEGQFRIAANKANTT